ncbi:28S ribosomal protein S10, mitochondrial [Thelohanellus kitauei]|uniref:Small ribosomal subunit protein uS10m n=1 Tax=Thelohanellus kitauei TaxID=669202 RepID=A0A0C2M9R7_THEKT|nr:28S ribosomal protein S10, mitochondrial [Thelohanellus kitauei]
MRGMLKYRRLISFQNRISPRLRIASPEPTSNKPNYFSVQTRGIKNESFIGYTFKNTEPKQLLFESITIKLFSHDEVVLETFCKVTQQVLHELGIENSGVIILPYKNKIFTTLRSPFIFTVARAQYEIRTFRRYFELRKLTEDTANTVLSYLQYHLPEGMAMHVKHVTVLPCPRFLTESMESDEMKEQFENYKKESNEYIIDMIDDLS